jgi:hypothetical protein
MLIQGSWESGSAIMAMPSRKPIVNTLLNGQKWLVTT